MALASFGEGELLAAQLSDRVEILVLLGEPDTGVELAHQEVDALLLDLRTVLPEDDDFLVEAIVSAIGVWNSKGDLPG